MVPSIHYTIVDAFTSSSFSGNPAAVVILSRDHGLPDSTLQSIAAEFNLSETAFVVPKTSSPIDNPKEFDLRWFTPAAEVPLCGHATLASARVLFASPSLVSPEVTTLHFDTLSGILGAQRISEDGRIELQFPEGSVKAVDKTVNAQINGVIGKAFGDVVEVLDVQVGNAVGYLDFMLIQVSNDVDLEGTSVDVDAFRGVSSHTAFIVTSSRPSVINPNSTFIARVFAPAIGIPEDPVTGSAHCILAPFWKNALSLGSQSTMIGRQVGRRGGETELIWDEDTKRVHLRGDAVVVARGEMYL